MCEAAAARLCMLPDIAAITLAAVAVEEGGRLGAGASGEVCRGEASKVGSQGRRSRSSSDVEKQKACGRRTFHLTAATM